MKAKTIQSALFALLCATTGFAGAQGPGAGSVFSRVDGPAKKVPETYTAIHEGFCGVGKERTFLKAALDGRPDGRPCWYGCNEEAAITPTAVNPRGGRW